MDEHDGGHTILTDPLRNYALIEPEHGDLVDVDRGRLVAGRSVKMTASFM